MISVAIVTAKRDLRNGWQSAVEAMSNAQCVGAFPAMTASSQIALGRSPDVVLLGLESTDDSSSSVQLILEQFSSSSILVLAASLKDKQFFSALRAGANGYLEQKIHPSHLQKAIIELYPRRCAHE